MRSSTKNPNGRGKKSLGFTLVEVLVATAISSIVSLVAIYGLVEGLHLFKSNSTEMIARDKGSYGLRRMSIDMQQATKVQIFSTYLTTASAETQYGSCAVIQTASGGSVAYYLYASSNTNPNSGGLYYRANASTAPNPSADKLIVSSLQDMEFRRDQSGSIRIGLEIGIFGYPGWIVGGKETDKVRVTTSVLPRNL